MNGKEINILLFGEHQQGKSTFINSFAQYIQFESFAEALKAEQIEPPVPGRFRTFDKSWNAHRIDFGENGDKYEEFLDLHSRTSGCKSYAICLNENVLIRFIDTPGLNRYGKEEEERQKLEKMLEAMANYAYLNFIFVFGAIDECYLRSLFGLLAENAQENIVMIRTQNTIGFEDEEWKSLVEENLRKLKSKQPSIKLEVTQNNFFSFENDHFEHLIAAQRGIHVHRRLWNKGKCEEDWKNSRVECERLVRSLFRMGSVGPHVVGDTLEKNGFRKNSTAVTSEKVYQPKTLSRAFETILTE